MDAVAAAPFYLGLDAAAPAQHRLGQIHTPVFYQSHPHLAGDPICSSDAASEADRGGACVRTWCSRLPAAHGGGGPCCALLRRLHGLHQSLISASSSTTSMATTPPPSGSPGTSVKGLPFPFRGATPSTAVSTTRIGSIRFRLCLEMAAEEEDFSGDRTLTITTG